jgi:hypothetical protein
MNILLLHGGTPRLPLQAVGIEGSAHIRELLIKVATFRLETFGQH